MTAIKDHITNILSNKVFCTLCLKNVTDDALDIDDEVCLNIQTESYILYSEIIETLFSKEFQQEICTMTRNICEKCARAAVDTYRFIKMCQDSRNSFSNTVEMLTDCVFDDTIGKQKYVKSVYLALVSNNKCTKYYDNYSKGTTLRKALQRFKKIGLKQKLHKRRKIKKEKVTFLDIEDGGYDDGDTDIRDNDTDNVDAKYKCIPCSKEFTGKIRLNYHNERVHAPKIYKCDKCPKMYSKAYILKEHMTESHVSAMCAICGKTYKGSSGLKQHLYSHNNLKCEKCGRRYKSRQAYRKHIKTEICTKPDHERRNLDRNFVCDVCNKTFTQKGTMKAHKKFEHENGKSYTCRWCNQKFPAVSRLKSHIVKHTRERNFTCEICGGKFVTKEALLYHTRIHTGETPYKCPHCEMRFLSTSRRMDHVRRKHMEPSHECDICGGKYKTKCALTKHRRRHSNPNSKLYMQSCSEVTVAATRF